MKKLVMGIIAATVATSVHAATVSWSLEKDSNKLFGDLTAYVINGSDYDAVTALLAAGGESVGTSFSGYAIDSAVLNSRGAGGSATEGVTGTSLAWFIFAGNSIANGSSYSTTGALNISDYSFTPPQSSPGEFTITVDSFTTKGSPIGGQEPTPDPEEGPEPTSGVLLAIGAAMLGLRRKRA